MSSLQSALARRWTVGNFAKTAQFRESFYRCPGLAAQISFWQTGNFFKKNA
jgi:hypothetical protein